MCPHSGGGTPRGRGHIAPYPGRMQTPGVRVWMNPERGGRAAGNHPTPWGP